MAEPPGSLHTSCVAGASWEPHSRPQPLHPQGIPNPRLSGERFGLGEGSYSQSKAGPEGCYWDLAGLWAGFPSSTLTPPGELQATFALRAIWGTGACTSLGRGDVFFPCVLDQSVGIIPGDAEARELLSRTKWVAREPGPGEGADDATFLVPAAGPDRCPLCPAPRPPWTSWWRRTSRPISPAGTSRSTSRRTPCRSTWSACSRNPGLQAGALPAGLFHVAFAQPYVLSGTWSHWEQTQSYFYKDTYLCSTSRSLEAADQ